MKGIDEPHKLRELSKQVTGWIRPATIKTAFVVLRLVDLAIRIIARFM